MERAWSATSTATAPSDLLWDSGAAGALGIWLMKDGQIAAGPALNHDMPGWSVAAVGDFNGDGTSDLLWSSGEQGVLGLWLMKNGAIDQTVALNHDMPGWTVAAAADFNHDGTSDLLWRNAANGLGTWIMQNGHIVAAPMPAPPPAGPRSRKATSTTTAPATSCGRTSTVPSRSMADALRRHPG